MPPLYHEGVLQFILMDKVYSEGTTNRDPALDWDKYCKERVVGEAELIVASTLEEKLNAACVIMHADMLGFQALAGLCARNRVQPLHDIL